MVIPSLHVFSVQFCRSFFRAFLRRIPNTSIFPVTGVIGRGSVSEAIKAILPGATFCAVPNPPFAFHNSLPPYFPAIQKEGIPSFLHGVLDLLRRNAAFILAVENCLSFAPNLKDENVTMRRVHQKRLLLLCPALPQASASNGFWQWYSLATLRSFPASRSLKSLCRKSGSPQLWGCPESKNSHSGQLHVMLFLSPVIMIFLSYVILILAGGGRLPRRESPRPHYGAIYLHFILFLWLHDL